ncbi:hypothetical protein KIH74_08940 [Kineosporia sp. J2-2]|uniref:Uncharacterized protein n=1 Tax=Kineosporia corallincola TaxID=2835133 RepID=A0ABS5TD87_9ACTN|nr:hypothetical protein [Kineosporia corallincola]MBT0769051.1 hypothetical protein [Kineosporia corallincola]
MSTAFRGGPGNPATRQPNPGTLRRNRTTARLLRGDPPQNLVLSLDRTSTPESGGDGRLTGVRFRANQRRSRKIGTRLVMDDPAAVTHSRLGFRSLFSVPQQEEPDIVGAVTAQLVSWLRSKNYDADALRDDELVPLAKSVTGSTHHLKETDGSVIFHARVIEALNGTWTSKLTVHLPGRPTDDAAVLLEVSGPSKPGPPRLAKLLTGALSAHDSLSELGDVPKIVRTDDVDALVDVICDPDRRGLVFVAGMHESLPYDRWYTFVKRLLAASTGLAGKYFLDSAATVLLAESLGRSHAVSPGSVRTYMPGADPASELDALRHRILSTARISRDTHSRMSSLLRNRAHDEMLRAELPGKVRRIERRIADHLDRLLVAPPEQPVAPVASQIPTLSRPVEITAAQIPQPVRASPVDASALAAVQRVFQVDEPKAAHWERLAELALLGLAARENQERVVTQLSRLRDELEDSASDQKKLRWRLDDEQLEHSEALAELDAARRRNAYLEKQLIDSNQADLVYAGSAPSTRDEVSDFEEVLIRAQDLEHVVITCPESVPMSLTQHDPLGEWARKTWQILGVLDDYAAASLAGHCTTDVAGYLRNTPDGYRGYSANRHAVSESEDVRNNSKFRDARVLPVPESVVATGWVEMMAHFKIAQSGMISPRLHYYDDTSRSAKIYVGHIGQHLPTKRTN